VVQKNEDERNNNDFREEDEEEETEEERVVGCIIVFTRRQTKCVCVCVFPCGNDCGEYSKTCQRFKRPDIFSRVRVVLKMQDDESVEQREEC